MRTAMRTEERRRIYRQEGDGYPSDLRNAEWARPEPLIPKGVAGRTTARDRHAIRDKSHSLFAVHRLPWRYLSRDSFGTCG
jgi:hypothetical protein